MPVRSTIAFKWGYLTERVQKLTTEGPCQPVSMQTQQGPAKDTSLPMISSIVDWNIGNF